jgi:hypothetical protein
MTDIAATLRAPDHVVAAAEKPKLDSPSNPLAVILFFGFLAAGILYMAYSVYVDVDAAGAQATTYLPYLVGSPEERTALVALAEGVRGVVGVSDEMIPSYG